MCTQQEQTETAQDAEGNKFQSNSKDGRKSTASDCHQEMGGILPIRRFCSHSASLRIILFSALAIAWTLLGSISAFGEETVPAAKMEDSQIRIGVLAKRGSERCAERWGATAEYLSKQIPEYSFTIVPLPFDDVYGAIERSEVEFILANSAYYVDLEVRFGARRIATINNLHSDGSSFNVFASALFCKADRTDIQSVQDLKNTVFMSVDERSLGGWLMTQRELKECGIDPNRYFAALRYGDTHDAVVYAVRDGKADAGTVRSDTLERMALEGKIDLADFKLLYFDSKYINKFPFLHSTRHYPEWPFAKVLHTSDKLAKQVAIALLQMPVDSPAAQSARCAGWTIPENYQPVHEGLKAIRATPYENYGKVTLLDVFQQHGHWLLSIFVLITMIAVFATRIAGLKARLKLAMRAREERERLLLAIEQVAETIVITDVEATIQYVNPAFERITGYTHEEAIGQNPSVLKSGKHNDAFYKEMWDTLTRGETWRGHLVNKKKNGMLYTEEATISPVHDASGATINYVAVKRDITQEIKLEEQLRQAQKMESVGRLAGGVAHDFNNLLMGIMGYVELCRDEIGPDHPIRGWLDEITHAAQRSAGITQQLLAFARKQPASTKVLNLNEAVTNTLKILRRLIGEDIELGWLPGAGLWPIRISPTQVDQILANLCINARDAIEGVGKLKIETGNITLDEAYCDSHAEVLPGDYVMLAVSDNGKGMDRDTLDHLFEPFFTTKAIGKGTGLGLATVYGIVKQSKGSVGVYSEPGKGTTFRIYLPKYTGTAIDLSEPKERAACPHGNETILLVEDEEAVRTTVAAFLHSLDYTVLVAETPESALQIATKQDGTIHLLLTDLVMPGMSGRDLASCLLKRYSGMKCIFMSGYTANVIIERKILDLDVDFLPKPFTRDQLAQEVRKVLDAPQAQKKNPPENDYA